MRVVRTWARRSGAGARRHWFFLTLLALGLALRVIVMIAYRPVLLYIDSLGSYLASLPTLDPSGQDPIGYDVLLLKPVLEVSTLFAVAAVQHLLGLGMAVVTYALIVHKGGLDTGRWRALAALATAPILLDAYQLQIEHMVMSDSLFQAMLVAALAVLAWPQRPTWRRAVLAGLLLGAAVTVRAVGEFTLAALVLYILVTTRTWRRRALLTGAAAVAFAAPLAVYMTHFHAVTGHWGLTNVAGTTLYGRVATFADCSGVDMPDYQRPLCPTTPVAQRYGPDYWAHDPASPASQPITPPPGKTGNQVLKEFSLRVIRHEPLVFARSVLSDATRLFSWQRTDGRYGDPVVERWQFQTSYTWYPPTVTPQVAAEMGQRYGGGRARVVVPLAAALRWYQLHMGFTPGPAVALCVALALLVVTGAVRRARRSPLRSVVLLYLLVSALVVLLADVFEFSWRYQLPAYVLVPAAGVLALAAMRVPRSPAPATDQPSSESAGGAPPADSPVPDCAQAGSLRVTSREALRESRRDDPVPQRRGHAAPGLRDDAEIHSWCGLHRCARHR